MKKTQSEPIVYIVLEKAAPHVTLRNKQYPVGTVFEVAPGDKPVQSKVDRLVKYAHVRVATDEDKRNAAAAILVDKQHATAAAASPVPEAAVDATPGEFQNLQPWTIAPSPINPRRNFDDASMQELTDSVREKGVRVAINVRAMPADTWYVEPGTRSGKPGWFLTDRRRFRPNPGTTGGQIYEHLPDELMQHFFPDRASAEAAMPKWEIIAGERRWRASRYAGCETIRAIVETMDDLEAAELQVIENDQREDLSPLESAAGYQYLLSQPGYDIKKLIQKTGKSKTTIYDRLKLLEMPAVLQDAVVAGVCPMSTAQKIGAAAPEIREVAAKRILGLENNRGQALKPRSGQRYEVQTYREAEETLEGLKNERERQAEYDRIKAELVKEGFKIIEGGEATNVLYHDGSLVHGSGYVRAGDICPRDPKSRQWEKVLKGQDVTRYAAITGRWNGPAKGVRVYKLEDANKALKKLGLWDVEGSKASEEKIERQKKREKAKAEMGAMHADLDRIVATASVPETKQVRAVLQAVLQKMLPSYDDEMVRMLAERRKRPTADFTRSTVRKSVEKMTLGEMLGLVAEVCTYGLGYRIDPANGGNYLREGRRVVSELLGIKPAKGAKASSPDVRTEDETADEEEEAEVLA